MLRLFEVEGLDDAKISWKTQYVIPPSVATRAAGKRPDIVGRGRRGDEGIFVIVENKMGAGYTAELNADTGELKNQLWIYREFLEQQRARHKSIRLLTYRTARPDGWPEVETQRWRALKANLEKWRREGLEARAPVASRFAYELVELLEELGVAPISVSLEDIASNAAAGRLRMACEGLGEEVWEFRDHPTWVRLKGGGLDISRGYGKFEGRFTGVIFTFGGTKVGDVAMLIALGVLREAVVDYQIELSIEHVPEFHGSIALWGERSALSGTVVGSVQKIVENLGSEPHWAKREHDYDEEGTAKRRILIARTKPFTEVFGRVDDWTEEAVAFFRDCLSALGRLDDSAIAFIRSWRGEPPSPA